MYIGPHTCMSGYVSAYHGVGKLCILLHTVLCHAVHFVSEILNMFEETFEDTAMRTFKHEPFCIVGDRGGGGGGAYSWYFTV